MNFVGKFDAKLHVDGSGAHPDARHHVDSISAHAPSDAIIVPDADLLFNGDFKRSGVDLILSRDTVGYLPLLTRKSLALPRGRNKLKKGLFEGNARFLKFPELSNPCLPDAYPCQS